MCKANILEKLPGNRHLQGIAPAHLEHWRNGKKGQNGILESVYVIRLARESAKNGTALLISSAVSSVRAHLSGVDDAPVTVRPALDRIPHLKELPQENMEDDFSELRRAEATGRPLGTPEFVTGLENLLGRKIARRAPLFSIFYFPVHDLLQHGLPVSDGWLAEELHGRVPGA